MTHRALFLFVFLAAQAAMAQQSPIQAPDALPTETPDKPWYQRIGIRGYGQFRYNRLLETNPLLQCDQCDRSWGGNGGFFIRRARIIFFGQVHRNVFIYLQPDFASTVGGAGHVVQLRDWYVDLGLDSQNEFRFRIGQSKVPYSFENLQSSQNRLPMDRADPTNSAAANERDIGVFFYWAPKKIRDRFRSLVKDGLKGSGDYGMFALGAFNGQTANRPEANNDLHVVSRFSYPFAIGKQIVEPGVAAYSGKYVVTPEQRSPGVKGAHDWNYRDERVLGSLALYPQPFGILAEYNVGRGPEFNPATDSIETRDLSGGFITATYQYRTGHHIFFPFMRYQVYDGGKKHERDARSYSVQDLEFGVEWQPNRNFELVVEYYISDRRYEDLLRPEWRQSGRLLRIQAQFNF